MAKTKSNAATLKEKINKEAKPLFSENAVKWVHIVVLSVVFWLLYYWIFNPDYIDLNGDNFTYFLLGKLLVAGKGFINATTVKPTPHIHFQPGFPVLIAICIALFNASMVDMAIIIGLLFWVSLIVLYLSLIRIQTSKSLAFVVVILVAFNQYLFSSSVSCMSEIPFVLAGILGIYFMVRAGSENERKISVNIILSAVFFAACYYIKTIGVALFGALFLYLLFSRKWKHLLLANATYILLVMPWIIRGKKVGSSYASQLMQINPYQPELGNLTLTTFIERVQNNFIRYVSIDIPTSIFGLERVADKTPFSYWVAGIAIITIMLYAIYRLCDFKLFFLGYIIAVFAILLIWPDVFGGLRFIEVLLPVFVFLLVVGVTDIFKRVFQKISLSFSPYWLLLLIFYFYPHMETLKNTLLQPIPQNYINYFELGKWAKENTPKDAIFSARKPDIFIYYSDRLTIGDKPSLSDTVVMDFFRENGVDYVVLEQLGFVSTPRYLYPAIQKNAEKFAITRQLPNPDTYLLKFSEGNR